MTGKADRTRPRRANHRPKTPPSSTRKRRPRLRAAGAGAGDNRMQQPLYLTTPLYYVNDEAHIGHAYTTILADVLARFHRFFGRDVHFLTGLDEHGQKVMQAAEKLGRTPQEHCDAMAPLWKQVWEQLEIEYDDFIRTTEPRHEEVVKEILLRLRDKGDIYQEKYEGWYSVFEERFFTEKDLVDGMDPIGGRPVEWIQETNYFFRMSRYQDWLVKHYEEHEDAVIPSFRRNEVLGFLRKPLGDLCISRPKSRLAWGIPLPWDEEYVTYVWFDALLNYYSATVSPPEGARVSWPADYHLIGKDILTTHAVYWPIMLHAAGIEPPRHILAHGWWLAKDAAKMSKSSGNVIRPLDLAKLYGADPFRYVLMREMVVGQDASFSEELFIKRVNSDLANDLGNLVNRVTRLVAKHFEGIVPEVEPRAEDPLAELAGRTAEEVRKLVERFQIHAAIEETLQFVRAINRDLSEAAPWTTVKSDREAAGEALARALEGVRIAAVLLSPVMPEKAAELAGRIGAEVKERYT
ncbi:MAG TPA: methionine--tRNA ligase, partial [Bacteroidetes bacterium]|nr:methionine--tRNA ligase [Bacteroidota bacterium]